MSRKNSNRDRVLAHARRCHEEGREWINSVSAAEVLGMEVSSVRSAITHWKEKGRLERKKEGSPYYRYVPEQREVDTSATTSEMDVVDRLTKIEHTLSHLSHRVERLHDQVNRLLLRPVPPSPLDVLAILQGPEISETMRRASYEAAVNALRDL